MEASDH